MSKKRRDWSGEPGWEEASNTFALYPGLGEVPMYEADLTVATAETVAIGKRVHWEVPSYPHLMHFIPKHLQGPYMVTPNFVQTYNDWSEALAESRASLHKNEEFMRPPEEWLDYERLPGDFRVDDQGYVLCESITAAGLPCRKRAENYTGHCSKHGAPLHPENLEFRVPILPVTKRKLEDYSQAELDTMTRKQLWDLGAITVEDLDDEELARGQFRGRDGNFTGKRSGTIPRAMHDKFVSELFTRADMRLQENLVEVVNTMTEVATSPIYEAKDRIKAAQWIFERVRGKNPETIIHTQDKPWEGVLGHLTAVSGGSREESRQARQDPAFTPMEARPTQPESSYIDVEPEPSQPNPNDPWGSEPQPQPDRMTSPLAEQPTGMSPDAHVPNKGFNREKGDGTEEQYEYTSITVRGDDGEDYDKVVAKPKKGSEAEAAQDKIKDQERRRKKALRAAKAKYLAEQMAKKDGNEE